MPPCCCTLKTIHPGAKGAISREYLQLSSGGLRLSAVLDESPHHGAPSELTLHWMRGTEQTVGAAGTEHVTRDAARATLAMGLAIAGVGAV